jgi:membrane glycosyltransferase
VPDIAARRWLFLFLVLATALAGVMQLWSVLRIDGVTGAEALVLILFAVLFAWIAASFWMAVFGAVAKMTGARLLPRPEARGPITARTAILMPVYNEEVARIFAGVEAICRSVADAGGTGFDFYILSDSTDPAHWVAEEVEWQRLAATAPADIRIFYRHRHRNIGRKSGNIQDFCENWGALYDYMVVLDADSLMSGQTLVRLVRLMEANPRAALIQAPAQLVGRGSLFARIQQFASSLYGPIATAGLAWLQGPDGNYWGHNAILRVPAFMAHGGLPKLPGNPPFGGEIMSHDFVEAALLVRAGWEVWLAPEIGGSFEEPPPTIYDHLKRDRRWCQGNLQHMRILLAQGLKMPSRLHLAMGIMSYLSSPLWLLLLVISAIGMRQPPPAPVDYFGRSPHLSLAVSHAAELLQLVLATGVLLYGPKFIALGVGLCDRAVVRAHGGRWAMLKSALWENLFSTLFAPIVMLAHSWFVFIIVMGISTGWGTQQRQDRALPFWFVVRSYWPHTLLGIAAAFVLVQFAPGSIGWFVPLLAGLILAIPLTALTSSLKLGVATAHHRLFLVPSETGGLAVLDEAHRLHAAQVTEQARDFPRLVLDDRAVRTLHLQLLREAPPSETPPSERLTALVAAARRQQTAGFTRQDWTLLLSDAGSLEQCAPG